MMEDFKNEVRNEILNTLNGLKRNPNSKDEYEEAGEEIEEAEGPKDEREEIFLRAVAQTSKVHKVEVSNFFGMLNSEDLINWIKSLEDYFEFEDVKDP